MTQGSLKVPLVVVAVIDEQACIGCTLCIEACPVDAIVGSAQLMHTVIAAECTGCRLCLPPCPVDCIEMVKTGTGWTHEERRQRAGQYRRRHAARAGRKRVVITAAEQATDAHNEKQATIERAMQRAHQRLRTREKP